MTSYPLMWRVLIGSILLAAAPSNGLLAEASVGSGPPVPMQHDASVISPTAPAKVYVAPVLSPVIPARPVSSPVAAPAPSIKAYMAPVTPFAPAKSVISPSVPSLNEIQGLQAQGNQVRLLVRNGDSLIVKNTMLLNNPGRLVVDIANAKLGSALTPLPSGSLSSTPITSIRLAQFTADTVRLVVEAPDPEHLRVSTNPYSLAIVAERPRSFISGLYKHLFGKGEPEPATKPQLPARQLPPATPPADTSSVLAGLDNLRRLQMEQMMGRGGDAAQRNRIVDLARGQLGISKDVNPDYVMTTYSRGKDQSWCADFISTVLEWSGGSPWGHLSRVQDIYDWGVSNNRLSIQPAVARIVVISYGGSGSFDHAAIVESLNPADGTFATIGGNEGYAASAASGTRTRGVVARNVYSLTDKRILGFVDPLPVGGFSSPSENRTASIQRDSTSNPVRGISSVEP